MTAQVLVIGNDLAGWIAAWHLNRHGCEVAILPIVPPDRQDDARASSLRSPFSESSRHSKRASHAGFTKPVIYAGDPLPLQQLLEDIGEGQAFHRGQKLAIEFLGMPPKPVRLRKPKLPGVLPFVMGLPLFTALPLPSRFNLLNYLEKLWEEVCAIPADADRYSAAWWVHSFGQCATAQAHVWNPLCHFFLGSGLEHTSAGEFIAMLRRMFLSASCSRFLFLADDVSIVRQPLQEQLAHRGVAFLDPVELASIDCTARAISGIRTQAGDSLHAEWYVSSLRPDHLRSLISERVLTKYAYFHDLEYLAGSSRILVQWKDSRPSRIPRLVFLPKTFQWMIIAQDASASGQCQITLGASGHSELRNRSDSELFTLAYQEYSEAMDRRTRSTLKTPSAFRVVRECDRTLFHQPGISIFRPPARSPLANLVLAAEWTDTGAPPALAGALASGQQCASLLLAHKDSSAALTSAVSISKMSAP